MARKLLSILIPVRSEEENIGTTIRLLSKTVHTPHTIIIADDTVDPSDRTLDVVFRLRQTVRVCKKKKHDADGFGPALVRASNTVTTPYTVIVMADLSDDPRTIDRMMAVMNKKKCDIVCGSRYMNGGKKIGGPFFQGVLSTILNWMLYHGVGFPTRDTTNAFKMYRTEFLHTILPKNPKSGVEFSFQLMIRAVSHHARIIDIPTVWRGREKGQSKVRIWSRGPLYLGLFWESLKTRCQMYV